MLLAVAEAAPPPSPLEASPSLLAFSGRGALAEYNVDYMRKAGVQTIVASYEIPGNVFSSRQRSRPERLRWGRWRSSNA